MSEEEFRKELSILGINISDEKLKQFSNYADYLLEYNSHTNLTAIRNREDIYLKHFYDSLLLLKYIKFNDEKILDIGSGAGFPGVPLKIVCPNIKLTVLDSNGKKTEFLKKLSDKIDIKYDVINDRAENYVKNNRDSFDVVLSRAVTQMPILAELSLPFVKDGGLFIPYKGAIDETLEDGIFAIKELGGDVVKVEKDYLPSEQAARSFIIVKKICKTDDTYPRLFEKIIKKPLQKNQK